ncbi:porin, partial [Bacillus licheniformis]|nr:porin [Bacillus licheniformis]
MRLKYFAWLIAAATPAAAFAQTSVTLYGRIDGGIEYLNHIATPNGSKSRWSAESGDWGTSLWGLKGSEDIGGGNKILFHLEGAFNTMNGGFSGSIWDRFATVGISNDRYGT